MSEKGEYVPSPRPNPRLRPEGAAYAERNRGTMERWFDYSDTLSGSAKANGTSGGGDHAGTQAPWAESERHYTDAEGGRSGQANDLPADLSDSFIQEGAMQDLMQKSSELSLNNPPGPAEEAREYAQRNRGSMERIINNYKASSPPQSPQHHQQQQQQQSLSTSFTQESEGADSSRQRTLHKESQGRTWDETRPAPRIRPDGESIALKNSTDSMFGIMRSDNPSPQESPVKTGPHSSRHSQESATPPQSASQPRARPGEGMKNYERAHDQSEMAAILRGEGDTGRSAAPRNIRHLQRSELW